MGKSHAAARHSSWAAREYYPKRSGKQWLRTNRGSKDRHMAQYEIGKPVYPRYVVFHQGGAYRLHSPLEGGRAKAHNAMFGRKPKGNGKRVAAG
jgi:hypothetical protein